MAVAKTKTDICNLALGLLGQPPVNDIEAPALTTNGQIVSQWYDNARQQMLQEHVWRFAITRQQLNAEGATPEFGWSYQYLLPATCLTLLQVGPDDYPLRPNLHYVVESNRILTADNTPLPVRFIDDVVDVTKMHPTFKNALATLVAAFCAVPVLKSNEKAGELRQTYEQLLSLAGTVNAIENKPKIIDRSRWRDAQLGLTVTRTPDGMIY